MAKQVKIRVQQTSFDIAVELQALRQACSEAGAIVSFIGLVRDIVGGQVLERMQIEHYPIMTEKALQKIVSLACDRWALLGVHVIHRMGELRAHEEIVLVAVASLHRQDAFEACAFIMDFLKTEAPFWKKEMGQFGEHWVEARETDQQAKEKWTLSE